MTKRKFSKYFFLFSTSLLFLSFSSTITPVNAMMGEKGNTGEEGGGKTTGVKRPLEQGEGGEERDKKVQKTTQEQTISSAKNTVLKDDNENRKRVQDKIAIVTGGASGIGEATCIMLAKHGAKVAVTDINQQRGQAVVEKIKSFNGIACYYSMDVSKETEVQNTVGQIEKDFGKIDVLVNNAGIAGVNKPTHEITESEWDQCLNTNLKGAFFCTKHVVPYMQKNGKGSIVNISSIYGIVGSSDVPPYHVAKAGLRIMSKTDANLYGKNNIRVNSIHPSCIKTPMGESLGLTHPGGMEGFYKDIAALHPLKCVGEPDDIAYGILYLASDESKFVTGTELVIDGGFTSN